MEPLQSIRVQEYSQDAEGFWPLMGPMFASAQLKKQMGVAMSSDETYRWFLAFGDGGTLVGFCAMTPERYGCRLRYVHVEIDEAFIPVVGVATTASVKPVIRMALNPDAYLRFGFKPTGKTKGRYVELIKDA